MHQERAIGVFDSGLGGLTVLSSIHRLLPNESTVYLGDTARLPYGTKSKDSVIRYSLNNARMLMQLAPLKMLVVACSTATSHALDALKEQLPIPVIGVIDPMVDHVMRLNTIKSIAILATRGTTQSHAYETHLRQAGFAGEIYSVACPLFVPLVEEGLVTGSIAESVVERYLHLLPSDVDAVILGCTHYPLLLPTLQKAMPAHVKWLTSGDVATQAIKKHLELRQLQAPDTATAQRRYVVTDAVSQIESLAESFLSQALVPGSVEVVDINIENPHDH